MCDTDVIAKLWTLLEKIEHLSDISPFDDSALYAPVLNYLIDAYALIQSELQKSSRHAVKITEFYPLFKGVRELLLPEEIDRVSLGKVLQSRFEIFSKGGDPAEVFKYSKVEEEFLKKYPGAKVVYRDGDSVFFSIPKK